MRGGGRSRDGGGGGGGEGGGVLGWRRLIVNKEVHDWRVETNAYLYQITLHSPYSCMDPFTKY